MWTCKKCEKPVYFAERIQSLGFDWHPPCLVCKECGKKLHPGQHAEHAAEPYCHHPCYGALFGPRLFGHGTRNECHGAFGKANKPKDAERAALESKVKEYNQFYDGKPGEITCREANGRVVLEGMLRIYWSVNCLIHLKEEDETNVNTTGVCRSTSNSSVNNSVASDDSDTDEPLWRDDTPPSCPSTPIPSTPSTPIPSTPSTPTSSTPTPSLNSLTNPLMQSESPSTIHPNWPPTPYATLKSSSSNSSISSLQEGPQSSPVQSYTHSVPLSMPLSHPPSSLTATDNEDSLNWEADNSGISYATMKLRTIRRRKLVDKSVTQSLTEAAMRVNDALANQIVDNVNDTNGNKSEIIGTDYEILRNNAENIINNDVIIRNKIESNGNKSSVNCKVVKRVSFSQVDLKDTKVENEPTKRVLTKGKAVLLRRRPGRRMDKKKLKRRCSINGHLYLRETSSFHLDTDCPPAVVRITSLTSTEQLIATILEKYKIEMSISNFALYVFKDNGEQRKLSATASPLTHRVLLGPRDNIARLVLCDDNKTTEITPQMAEFVHLSLTECKAILRQYEHEENREIRNIKSRYDDMKFYIQYWLEQMDRNSDALTVGDL